MDDRPISLAIPSLRRKSGAIHIGTPANLIPTVEGIGSPRDLTQTIPGVLTKLESRIFMNCIMDNESSSQNVCLCCSKQSLSICCKKCTLEKLKFYSRRERLAAAEKEKANLVGIIDGILKKRSDVQAECNSTESRMVLLRRDIESRKQAILAKKEQIKKMEKEREACVGLSSQLTNMFSKHEEKKVGALSREEEKRQKLVNTQLKIAELRSKLTICICCIFPVAEYLAEAVRPGEEPSSNSKWAVVSGNDPLAEGRIFKIGATSISESLLNRLSCELTNSSLYLPSDLRSPFAAVGYTFQLMHLLALLFDYRLPYNISYRDYALCDHWSKELFDNRWLKLSEGVLAFCFHLGISPQKLQVHFPHSNIIEIATLMVQGAAIRMSPCDLINSSHREEIGHIVSRPGFEERDLNDWDICADLDA